MSLSGALINPRNMNHKQRLRSDYTSKLEVESQRMEDRLKMLKTMMAAEKAKRDAEGSIHWKSGQTMGTAKKPSMRNGGRPIRVRVLTDKESKSRTKCSSSNYTPCGQCDKTNASLSCVECAENYCQVCFIKFHQKGALAKHHVKPYLAKAAKQRSKRCTDDRQQHTNTSTATAPNSNKNKNTLVGTQDDTNFSLLDGTYDEAASAALFQQALAEWRKGGSGSVSSNKTEAFSEGENPQQTKDLTSSTVSSTSTNTISALSLTKGEKPVEVIFSRDTGISYFERIITKRNRYDPTLLKKIGNRPTSSHITESDKTNSSVEVIGKQGEAEHVPTQYNVFYDTEAIHNDQCPTEYVDDDCEDYRMYRPLSSVQIEEIEHIDSENQSRSSRDQPVSTMQISKVTKMKQKDALQSNKRKEYTSQRPKKSRVTSGKRTTTNRKGTSQQPKSSSCSQKQLSSYSGKSTLGMSDIDMKACVKNVWSECSNGIKGRPDSQLSTAIELSQFFLHGVEQKQAVETDQGDRENDTSPQFEPHLQFAASIWLPGNSTITDTSTASPTMTKPCNDYSPEDSDSDNEPEQGASSPSPNYTTTGSKSKMSWSENLIDSIESTAEKSEWDQEDNDTLESLAWELASTVESEGRLSRCDSVFDNIDDSYDYQSSVEDQATGYGGDEVEIGDVDMEKVLSKFELYQKQLMDEEM